MRSYVSSFGAIVEEEDVHISDFIEDDTVLTNQLLEWPFEVFFYLHDGSELQPVIFRRLFLRNYDITVMNERDHSP